MGVTGPSAGALSGTDDSTANAVISRAAGSTPRLNWLLVRRIGVLAVIAAARPGAKIAVGGAFSPGVVIALVVGALLIAASWTLSLRARPVQLRRRTGS